MRAAPVVLRIVLAAALIPCFAVTARGQQYLIKETFEDGDWDGGAEVQKGCRDCLQIVSPSFGARSGKNAARLEWNKFLFNRDSRNSKSTELRTAGRVGRMGWRDDVWCGFSVYLPDKNPDGFRRDSQPVLIHQFIAFHEDCPGWDKSLGLNIYGDRLALRYFYGEKKKPMHVVEKTVTEKIPRDRWIDFVIHVKFDRTGTTGLIQFWMDGKLILDLRGIQVGRGCPEYGPYVKWGPYQFRSSGYNNRVLYYDEIRLGVNLDYDAVAPRSPPGAPPPKPGLSVSESADQGADQGQT